ncbi:tetratricopeptide repeat protein [Saccharicrinis sp. FJH54]|uniref:tetratricopeptide repeat protein n=1 Tax=Saccharicrinis sp. FJH54 TaxID=3344665 RepID=UPI0035D4C2AE
MKKLFLIFTAGLMSTGLFAQKGAVSYADYELTADKPDYEKAISKIEEAVKDDKTKEWPKTYVVKERVYRTVYEKKDKKQAYIDSAYNALMRADFLDRRGDEKGKKKGKYQKDILLEMVSLRNTLINEGVYANNELKDYERTLSAFEKVLALDKNETYLQDKPYVMDTVIMYNTLATAYSAQKYNKVVELAPEVIKTGYQEDQPYLILYDSYKNLNDTAKMLDVLKEALLKYPDKKVFLDQLVYHYVEMGNAEEGINYIQQSLAKDPNNAQLLFILGTFYDEIGQRDKAIEAYKKVNEVDNATESSITNANYNLGVIYYNVAVEAMNDANEIKDYKKFKAAEEKAVKEFEVCIPYFEKCLEVDPNNVDALQALKPVYYRLIKFNNTYQQKYNQVMDKLKALGK